MKEWIRSKNFKLKNEARAKLYVAITRARKSVAIILNFDDVSVFNGIEKLYTNIY